MHKDFRLIACTYVGCLKEFDTIGITDCVVFVQDWYKYLEVLNFIGFEN